LKVGKMRGKENLWGGVLTLGSLPLVGGRGALEQFKERIRLFSNGELEILRKTRGLAYADEKSRFFGRSNYL